MIIMFQFFSSKIGRFDNKIRISYIQLCFTHIKDLLFADWMIKDHLCTDLSSGVGKPNRRNERKA